MSGRPRWLAGDPAWCEALERAWTRPEAPGVELAVLRERPGRRRLCRVRLADGSELLVKQFAARGARHGLRRWLARRLRVDAAHREWRNLSRLAGRVAVPTPRALGVLPGGDRLLAMDFLEGATLARVLREPGRRAPLVRAVGDLVAALHAAGYAHRDLHHGNVLVTAEGPVLLDLQLARRCRRRAARLRDLGELDHALEGSLPLAQRVRLRARALGLARPFGPEARRELRAAGRETPVRARAHARSRARRAGRPGRRFARFEWRGERGLRRREIDAQRLREALEAGAGDGGKREHGRLLVREWRSRSPLAGLVQLVRGTPARRCWQAAFGLEAQRIDTLAPVAFLERRRLGLPRGSRLVLEDPRPARPCRELAVREPERVLSALQHLALRLHARGIEVAGLEAGQVWLAPGSPARLGCLEARFPGRLPDARRRDDLARLHASLPDAVPDAWRLAALARYTALLPFREPREQTLTRLVAEGLRPGSAWSGERCALARRLSRPG